MTHVEKRATGSLAQINDFNEEQSGLNRGLDDRFILEKI